MTRAASSSRSEFDSGLKRYVERIRRIPLLEATEEFVLAKRVREQGDRDAGNRIVNSHLRLVVRVALNYRGYGLPVAELISEGNMGLMQALERFEPDKGFRFATYAVWWIRAAIQSYIMRSKSLVKMGTTTNQRKLFFNLRKTKSSMSVLDDRDMTPAQVKLIAERVGVSEQDVIDMNRRLVGDMSLNVPLAESSSETSEDRLTDEAPSQEQVLAENESLENGRALLAEALMQLEERERHVFVSRRLSDKPRKLWEIADEFGVSRERVRQIEMVAFAKVQKLVTRAAASAPKLAAAA